MQGIPYIRVSGMSVEGKVSEIMLMFLMETSFVACGNLSGYLLSAGYPGVIWVSEYRESIFSFLCTVWD